MRETIRWNGACDETIVSRERGREVVRERKRERKRERERVQTEKKK